jgi:hypothetical protein
VFSHRLPWFLDLLKSSSCSDSIIQALNATECLEEECTGFLNMAIVYKQPKVLEYLLSEKAFDPSRVYSYEDSLGLESPSLVVKESHCLYWNFGSSIGVTPLQTATQSRETEMMRMLLKAGANPNAPSTLSLTDERLIHTRPLHSAATTGNTEAVKILVDYGVGLNIKNRAGHTALFYVCHQGNVEMMKLLLAYGASPVQGAKGVGPLDLILQNRALLKAYEDARPEGGYDLSLT